MATNFTVSVNRTREELHLVLAGDIDGSSALQVINAIEDNRRGSERILIHTDAVGVVHPFGSDTLRKNLRLYASRTSLIVSGRLAENLLP